MTVKEKLEAYGLFDQAIVRHGFLEYIRDYEIIGYLHSTHFAVEVQYRFKGCIRLDYKITVKPEHYSMDERLLDLNKQDEPDYPAAFVWSTGAYSEGWTLVENTDELNCLEKVYGMKFYQMDLNTNAYDLTIIFHDVDITELNRIHKKTNMTIKEEAKQLIDTLPDTTTWDDLMHKIYERQTIDAGVADSKAGRVIPVEKVRELFGLPK